MLAGILAAAVPGEIILTEQVYGAEAPLYYDEVAADVVPEDGTDADEALTNGTSSDSLRFAWDGLCVFSAARVN